MPLFIAEPIQQGKKIIFNGKQNNVQKHFSSLFDTLVEESIVVKYPDFKYSVKVFGIQLHCSLGLDTGQQQ